MSPSSRTIGIVAVLLVVASVATVLLSRREAVDRPEGSPEAAVQAYVEAVIDHDGTAILALMDPALPCTEEEVERSWWDEPLTVTLEDARTTGDTAVVTVAITHGSTGLLPDQWSEEQRFDLRRIDGDWVVTGEAWPWFECGMTLP